MSHSGCSPDPGGLLMGDDDGRDAVRPGTQATVSALLEYGWWASNGPTAGYMASVALNTACQTTGIGQSWARSVNLELLWLPAADRFQSIVSAVMGPARTAIASLTFVQGEMFAAATVRFSPPRGMSRPGDAKPPAVLPPEPYAEMAVGSSGPPVMQQFSYRPTVGADGRSAKDGWDLVWVRPRGPTPPGRIGIVRRLDCWYPPNHMRIVRDHLRGAAPLSEPPAGDLLAASILFSATDDTYPTDQPTLVANRIDTIADGHYYERTEVWSETGRLLVTASTLRRNRHL